VTTCIALVIAAVIASLIASAILWSACALAGQVDERMNMD
jgi:hypothetical protein